MMRYRLLNLAMGAVAILAIMLAILWGRSASAATLQATPATFAATVAGQQPGDTIVLAAGSYGDQVVRRSPVHLSGPPTAVFRSLSLQGGASGSDLGGFGCELAPNAQTYIFTGCIRLVGSPSLPIHDVALHDLAIHCGAAVAGIPHDSDPLLPATLAAFRAAKGSVIGYPTGVGIDLTYGHNISIDNVEVSVCDKGVGLSYSDHVTVSHSRIHDYRTTPLVAGGVTDLTISRNHFWSAHPFGWGTPGALFDHGDLIHVWTIEGGAPVSNLTISDNLLEQGDGTATLGIYPDDNGHHLGFPNARIVRNVILNGNNQGLRLENVHGWVTDNILLQTSGGPKDCPSFILRESDPVMTGNIACDSGKVFPSQPGNTALPAQIATPRELMLARRLSAAASAPN